MKAKEKKKEKKQNEKKRQQKIIKRKINSCSLYYNKKKSLHFLLFCIAKKLKIYVIIYPIKTLKIWNMLKRAVLISVL